MILRVSRIGQSTSRARDYITELTAGGGYHFAAEEMRRALGASHHAGGLDQVATILAELREKIDPKLLAVAAKTAPYHGPSASAILSNSWV